MLLNEIEKWIQKLEVLCKLKKNEPSKATNLILNYFAKAIFTAGKSRPNTPNVQTKYDLLRLLQVQQLI